ncbi:cation diffusion facilitator family transporter [Fulvivirgaceae bacterium PWU5]|uniref:Cation diffusion facilitator family transporter n=1 Tax=Dawidia cretensis TaxID=2782350 RepID=A0AAP2GPJ9_9BACT|nr:cation diffusion facilitator family transporter [Dawidia cretensis]MBT1708299.1 cation diffusion facilitator family transporter [Dawidia cretensis]
MGHHHDHPHDHDHDHAHDHGHSHAHGHHHHHYSGNNIAVAFWLNLGFALLELVGGLYTNSVAIMSDALHDLGDSLSLGTAWFFERKSHRQPDTVYTYGYKRFSLVGAFINAVVLTVGSIFILIEAFKRLWHPEQPDTTGMLIFAVIGILVNGAAMLRLKKGESINEKVLSLHFLEDVLGWVAVLIGSIVMKFADVPIIDPLLSMIIGGIILFNVYRNIRGAFQIMLQGVPHNISEERVRKELATFEEVEALHDLHLWTLDGTFNILTTHIVLRQPLDTEPLEALKTRIKKQLQTIGIQHATIEFEIKGYAACDTTPVVH